MSNSHQQPPEELPILVVCILKMGLVERSKVETPRGQRHSCGLSSAVVLAPRTGPGVHGKSLMGIC